MGELMESVYSPVEVLQLQTNANPSGPELCVAHSQNTALRCNLECDIQAKQEPKPEEPTPIISPNRHARQAKPVMKPSQSAAKQQPGNGVEIERKRT